MSPRNKKQQIRLVIKISKMNPKLICDVLLAFRNTRVLLFSMFCTEQRYSVSLDFRIQVPLYHLSLPPKIVSFHLYSNIWTSGKTVTKCQWTIWVCIIPGSQLAERTFRSRHHWLFHTLLTYITIQISLQLAKKKNLFCKVI